MYLCAFIPRITINTATYIYTINTVIFLTTATITHGTAATYAICNITIYLTTTNVGFAATTSAIANITGTPTTTINAL